MDDKKSYAISFEFFPPKTTESLVSLGEVATELASYQPAFMSVTYGAGGSTRDGTIETIKMLQKQAGVRMAPHLACMGSTRDELIATLHQYLELGVHRVVALRGDMPSGMGNTGEFRYASELVRLIRETTGNHFHIEVAAYPEIHPQALSVEDDLMSLKHKFDAGANSAITQYFFNPDAYFHYLDECAKRHIHMPITPGIMPITQFSRLARFSEMCGAEIPRWIRKRLESYGDDVESIQAFGAEVVAKLCHDLIEGGAPGLHFYTLNKSDAVNEVLKQMSVRGQRVVNIVQSDLIIS